MLSVILLAGAVPEVVSAANDSITESLDLTSESDKTGVGWSWNEATKTLTLSGIDMKAAAKGSSDLYGIKLPGDSTIVF